MAVTCARARQRFGQHRRHSHVEHARTASVRVLT
jgi:hypothetical protein